MQNSILDDVKQYIGACVSYDVFDPNIIMEINAAFVILQQLGAGPHYPFIVEDRTATWKDFSEDQTVIALAKQIVYSRTRLTFDPPSTSFVIKVYEDRIAELEWRLRDYCNQWIPDNPEPEPDEPEEPDNPDEPVEPEEPCDHEIATKAEIDAIIDMVFAKGEH